jgi:hypothetical protein
MGLSTGVKINLYSGEEASFVALEGRVKKGAWGVTTTFLAGGLPAASTDTHASLPTRPLPAPASPAR